MAAGASALTWRRTAPYRPLLVLVLVSSAASFAGLSVLSLFARDDLGASGTMVTLYFVVVAVAGTGVLVLAGHWSDRAGVRRVLVPAALGWVGAGYWALSAVRSYPAMVAVGAAFFCVIGVPAAQLLAFARDGVRPGADPAASIAVVGLVRIVFSVGSFLGFGAGGLGLAYLGARPVFRVAGALCLAGVLLSRSVLRTDRDAAPPTAAAAGPRRHPDRDDGRRLLLVLAVGMLFLTSGRIMQIAQLPLLIRGPLHAPVQLVGFAFAVPPLCELVLMPVMVRAATRWGRGRVFLFGAAAGVGYYAGLVVVATSWQLLLLQVGYAVYGAATVMVGIDLAQGLLAGRAGLATSVFLSHENAAVVQGSLVATVSAATLGPRYGFAVPAGFCLAGLLLTAGLFGRHPDRFDLRRRRVRAGTGPPRSAGPRRAGAAPRRSRSPRPACRWSARPPRRRRRW